MKFNVPEPVLDIGRALAGAGFWAYLVGGCVRDLLLGQEPKDWDIATDARPEEIQGIFPESVYENAFGTVGVKTSKLISLKNLKVFKGSAEETDIVEVTTFRKEGRYTDKRHPDMITFAKTIEEDLARRDFTINAMAVKLGAGSAKLGRGAREGITDPFGGMDDLKERLIRAVGKPEERFAEDALRLMRAVRFAAELGFAIQEQTAGAIVKRAGLLGVIAKERIRDEFVKIIMSDRAMAGMQMLEDLGLMRCVVSELREGIGCGQNKHHVYTVWEHNLRALDYAVRKEYSLAVRLASLLHDVGKPRTKRGEGLDSTFHGHEIVGARMTAVILDRLRFGKEVNEKVTHLVRHHLFYYNVGEVSPAGVRRFLSRVGVENIDDLMKVREADRIGSGVPKAVPYKLRHLRFMIEKVRRDPVSPKMLSVNGDDVMQIAAIPPGPKVGWILSALMDEVLDDPTKNTRDYLGKKTRELSFLSDDVLKARAHEGRRKIQGVEGDIEEQMKERYHV